MWNYLKIQRNRPRWLSLGVVLTFSTLSLGQTLLGACFNICLVLTFVYKVDLWKQLVVPELLLRTNLQNHECVGFKSTQCLFVNYKMVPFWAHRSSVVPLDTGWIPVFKYLWKSLQYKWLILRWTLCLTVGSACVICFALSPSGDSYIHKIYP